MTDGAPVAPALAVLALLVVVTVWAFGWASRPERESWSADRRARSMLAAVLLSVGVVVFSSFEGEDRGGIDGAVFVAVGLGLVAMLAFVRPRLAVGLLAVGVVPTGLLVFNDCAADPEVGVEVMSAATHEAFLGYVFPVVATAVFVVVPLTIVFVLLAPPRRRPPADAALVDEADLAPDRP